MPLLRGHWHPPGSAARRPAELQVEGGGFLLRIEDGESRSGRFDTLEISDRVGDIPRRLELEDGSIFETADNDAVDAAIRAAGHPAARGHLVHRLESRWRWILAALLLAAGLVFVTFRWGIPWAAREIALAMPDSANQKISEGALELLDKWVFEPSTLPQARREAIRRRFRARLLPQGQGRFRLHFRDMGEVPNAMALPSGDIVVTDRLVTLAESPEEIDSVLLHEIGHVIHRHGLQSVIRSSFVGIGALLVLGDVSAVNSLAAGLPLFLVESRYSRGAEAEADRYALEHLMALGEDPAVFGRMLQRLEAAARTDECDDEEGARRLASFLDSHPLTEDRVAQARRYSERFHAQRQ